MLNWRSLMLCQMGISPHQPSRLILATIVGFVGASLCGAKSFNWDWRKAQIPDQLLRDAHLKESDKGALATAIANEIRRQDDTRGPQKEPREAALETPVLVTDLSHDGRPDIIARAQVGCSADGNCPLWVFRKINGAYKLLLDGVGQTFTLQQTYTNGFRDIVIAMHGSAFDSMLTLYRYQNGSYHDRECYGASWLSKDDPSHQLEEPRIEPCR
jgi:hypothetical protein